MKTCIRTIFAVATAFFMLGSRPADACTAVIVSGKHTADGKAVMFKHRDSSTQKVEIEYFHGEKYRLTDGIELLERAGIEVVYLEL